jgi:hypothetical protein
VFLGAASGLRSQLGIATVVVCSDPSLPSIFRQPWTKRLLVAAAAGELVVDKLPTTPSRLAPPGLAARLVLGALAAGLFAQTRQAPWLAAAAMEPRARPSLPRLVMTCGRDSPTMCQTRPSLSSRTPLALGWPSLARESARGVRRAPARCNRGYACSLRVRASCSKPSRLCTFLSDCDPWLIVAAVRSGRLR